jgi:heptosyltransferase II
MNGEPNTSVDFKAWSGSAPPRKILAIRLQALGDTIITLPYLNSLKNQFPDLQIHFLTRAEVAQIPQHVIFFDKVITLGGGRNAKLQFLLAVLKLPLLWMQRYDAVLDLQCNRISTFVRIMLRPKAWSVFDRFSLQSAGKRTKDTIDCISIGNVSLNTNIKVDIDVESLLVSNHWKTGNQLVVLNPAGAFPSRNWPIQNYVEFAKLWLDHYPNTQFVILLLPALADKARHIVTALGEKCIDLTGKADQLQAFAVIKKASFVLSEDSGLMHMAWVQGVPTIALFSSSKKVWSAPQGSWSHCFDSADLECGPCMQEICKYGDNRCLTRNSPSIVFEKAKELLHQIPIRANST